MSFSSEWFELPEGSTPISDFSELKPGWVRTMGDLNRLESLRDGCQHSHKKRAGAGIAQKLFFGVSRI